MVSLTSLLNNNQPLAEAKYRARLEMVPLLARFGHRLGIPWDALGDHFGREVIIAQAHSLLESSSVAHADDPLDIIFLTMIGGHGYNTSVELVTGLALRERGHRVRFVVCDQDQPACEVKKSSNREHWQSACRKCWSYGQRLFSEYGFDVLPVSELLAGRTLPDSVDRWSDVVEASLLKHYAVGVLDDTADVRAQRQAFELATSRSHAVGEALVAMRPDRVIMSHGIYSSWGPQRELLNEAAIPVVTYGKCKKRQTQKFNWKTSADWWDVASEWEQVKDVELSPPQSAAIQEYLDSRRDHSADTLRYNFGDTESREATFERLGLSPGRPVFSAFTNVLWDAASAQRDIVFSDPVDWIVETVQWFARRPDLQLVVKVHPAEIVIGTNQPFASILRSRLATFPENVRIIEPGEPINSWSLIAITDLGIVHSSTVGLELPLEGVPCAVVSKTHFRDRGFTIDVSDRAEYFELLGNWSKRTYDIEEARRLAWRYAYLLFERYQLPFPFLYEPAHTDVKALAFDSIDLVSEHQTMKLVAEGIENMGTFLLDLDNVGGSV